MSWSDFISGAFILKIVGAAYAKFNVHRLKWQHPPDCTLRELAGLVANQTQEGLRDDSYITMSISFKTYLCSYLTVDKFLSNRLFEGKIRAWGNKVLRLTDDPFPPLQDVRIFPEQVLIPNEYWERNELDLINKSLRIISDDKEYYYTNVQFNRKQIADQLKRFFSDPSFLKDSGVPPVRP